MPKNQTTVKLYDTMTRKTLPLQASYGKTFRFYCCGPTVYGPAHIGNFRTFIYQDTLRRIIELSGILTKHVRNITNVDDKTIAGAKKANLQLKDFTDIWLKKFHADAKALNLLTPHVEPGAVEHIAQQIKLIAKLIAKKHAYVSKDGSVYFDISSFKNYGSLSRLNERQIITNKNTSGINADEYDKDSASDFALWKAHTENDGEVYWQSPWGKGRPGWHLECSAMSSEHLGDSFDLHGGGGGFNLSAP